MIVFATKNICIVFEGVCGSYASYLKFILINGKKIHILSIIIMSKDSNEIPI